MTDKELLTNVQEIQNLMVRVSTGEFFDEERDRVYRELYYKIKIYLKSRSLKNNNTFSSLSEFYQYWQENLPTYKDRRFFVHSLYKDVEEKLYTAIEASKPDESSPYGVTIDDLHEDIVLKCKEDFVREDYDKSVFEALKSLEIRVRDKSGLDNSFFGKNLMEAAFNPATTPFEITGVTGELNSLPEIFKGMYGAFRNPVAHRKVGLEKFEAFQILCFVSYLLDFVDSLTVKKENDLLSDEIPF